MAAPNGAEEIGAYVDAVAKQSGGGLQIRVLSRGETEARTGVTAAKVIEAVRKGDVPLGLLPAREFDAFGVTSLEALLAPLVVDSLPLEAALLRDQHLTTPMLDPISEIGIEGVGILPGPLVHPFGITGPLLAPSDFSGAKIAVSPGDVAARTLALLGAQPVRSEFNGASVDDVDGALLQLPSVTGNTYHAPGRSVTADVTLWPRPLVVVANAKALAALTDDQRAVLRDAVTAAAGGVVATDEAMDAEAEGIGCNAGLSLQAAGRADLDALRAAVRPVVADIAATEIGAALFARVDELKETLPAQQVLGCVVTPDSWPTEVSNQLDGTYTAVTTADDVVAQGTPEAEIAPENWGQWTLVVKNGRFAMTTENDQACVWGYGDWRMDDKFVRTTYDGGGGIAPFHAAAKPGEDFIFDWTDFGGVLKLTLAVDDGPDDQAFTRVSDIPDVTAFPARCAPPAAAFATP